MSIKSSLLMIVISLLILTASWAAYEVYQIKLSERQTEDTPARLTRLEAQFQADQAAIATLREQLDQYQAELESARQATAEFRQQTSIGMDDIRGRLGTSSQDWLYAEVEYLIRMANQRALMERDPASALTLLQLAQEILVDAGDLTAHALRQALTQDIAALNAVAGPEVEGVYLELSAQLGQVSELRQSIPGFEPKPPPVQKPEATPRTLTQRALALATDMGERMLALVDFRQGSVPVQSVLRPEEAYYLRQNLILKFRIAQLALLEKNQEVYQTSLAEARAWVLAAFDPDAAVTRAMLASLDRLHQVRVGGQAPDISNSLREVRKLLAKFHQAESR